MSYTVHVHYGDAVGTSEFDTLADVLDFVSQHSDADLIEACDDAGDDIPLPA